MTTSKQQVTVSPFIWNALREHGLPKAIEQLRIKVKEQKIARRLSLLSPASTAGRLSERTMEVIDRDLNYAEPRQPQLPLWHPPYDLRFEHNANGPFFRMNFDDDVRGLTINTSHRFFSDVYNSPFGTPETRTAIEIMLFCLGDASISSKFARSEMVASWSRRLDAALSMLASHTSIHNEEDEN